MTRIFLKVEIHHVFPHANPPTCALLYPHSQVMATLTNTITNPQVTPSPPSVERCPIKAYDYVDLTSKRKQQQNNDNNIDPPARPKNKLLYERRLDVGKHMNITVWYYTKKVLSFLIFSVVWTLINFATGVGIRIITRLPTKISVSIRVIQVLKYLYYFCAICIEFIRGGLKSKTSHIQNRYAR